MVKCKSAGFVLPISKVDGIKMQYGGGSCYFAEENNEGVKFYTPYIKIFSFYRLKNHPSNCYSISYNSNYKQDVEVCNPDYTRDTADVMPRFSRNKTKLQKYIIEHYKRLLNADRISGTIVVRVVIDKKGRVTRLEILKGIHPDFDQAAIDFMNQMPKWKSAIEKGEKVNCYVTITVKEE